MIIKPNTKLSEAGVKLLATVVSLVAIRDEVDEAGEFGADLYDPAHDTLFDAFHLLGEVGELGAESEPPLEQLPTICERDGARLFAHGSDLVHLKAGKETVVNDDHEMEGDLGSIVVDGHEWRWQEMVAGVIQAVDSLQIEPREIRPEPTVATLPNDPKERATALLEMIWPWLRQHDLNAHDTALLCTTLTLHALMHTPDPELAAWVRENVGTIADKVMAKTAAATTPAN